MTFEGRDVEDSYNYVDISTQMNNNDAIINYATTNCLTYKFDLTQVTMTYINNAQMPDRRAPTFTSK